MSFTAISAPTALGLSPNPEHPDRPRGTWRAPQALIDTGLLGRLNAANAGATTIAPYNPARDPASGIRNREGVASQTRSLAAAVGAVLDRGERVLLLGGDCSVLAGAGLALRRRGRFGLAFVDGHLDFRNPANTDRLSAAAGEDLAIVTGRGLPDHADIDGLSPYFADGDVVAIGEREHNADTADIHRTEIRVLDLDAVRTAGPSAAAAEARDRLDRIDAGYWVHLDLDVLDSELMPAVDSPQPDGLSRDELIGVLHALFEDERARGIDVTIYDPELDPDGGLARLVCDVIAEGLSR